MSEASELYDAILKGNAKKAEEVTKAALAANVDPSELVQKYMIPAMDEVGKRFECNDYFVPELLIAARAMKISLALITPYLAKSGVEPTARVVIGTVQGDLHDIGKNLVASMLEGGGFQVVDLGVNVAPQKFVEAAQEKEGTIVALSALLTTTMTMMKTVIDALSQAGIRGKTRVMVGGAPITQQYAEEIGADGYTDNAGVGRGPGTEIVAELIRVCDCRRCMVGHPPFASSGTCHVCFPSERRFSRYAAKRSFLLRRGGRHDPRAALRRSSPRCRQLARGLLDDPRIGWISITDNPGGGPMLPPDWLAGKFAGRSANIVIHLTCKDLNRSGLEAAAWRYASEGFQNILALTGDYPTAGFRGLPEPVFDLDSVGLIALLRAMNEGLEVPGAVARRWFCPRPTSSSARPSRLSNDTSAS